MAVPAEPPHAWVVEYRPLDRCFPPSCKIRSRDLHGYANDIMEDGDPGAYVTQGAGVETELFFQRGVQLGAGESFQFDLPNASYASELDVSLAAVLGTYAYDATITVLRETAVGAPTAVGEPLRVAGKTAKFDTPPVDDEANFARYGKHVRMPLPSRAGRALRVAITNHGKTKLAIGSPMVMRRVDGRGPRQGILVVHDALLFHEARAFLHDGTGDPKADWVRSAVAERGLYFPNGQSPGQGTGDFVVRFFTGSYFSGAFGWPGMFGKGFDERLPAVQPGPLARAAEQGFVSVFFGNNFTFLPKFGNVGWDVGYNSERPDHAARLERLVKRWAVERPDDDAFIVWWNSATHAPYPPGRKGSPAPMPPGVDESEVKTSAVESCWHNLLDGADRLKGAYDALRAASPHASRMMWLSADHSSATTKKMERRAYRIPGFISTNLLHACGGTAEEVTTPFAFVYDDPDHLHRAPRPGIIQDRTNTFVAWRAFESFFGIDLALPRTSTFSSPVFPDRYGPPVWDDRISVSVGTTATLRASRGDLSYAFFTPNLREKDVWSLKPSEQYLLLGGPSHAGGVMLEELFDNRDPYEFVDLAASRFEDTIRMRSELTDWLAAHWETHDHPRHRSRLVFPKPVEIDLFAPRPFVAVVDGTRVPATDGRLAHVRGSDITILEDAEPVGIVEVRGMSEPLTLKCSANGLPLDFLSKDRLRFNLNVARTNCPLPRGAHDAPGPGEVLFSFEPASRGSSGATDDVVRPAGGRGSATDGDELLAGMKRWGYVRDIDDKGAKKP